MHPPQYNIFIHKRRRILHACASSVVLINICPDIPSKVDWVFRNQIYIYRNGRFCLLSNSVVMPCVTVCRRPAVRRPGDRQDAVGAGVCGPDQVHLPEAGGAPAGADVHRRRSQAGARRLRPGQGKVARHRLHRRAGRHRSVWDRTFEIQDSRKLYFLKIFFFFFFPSFYYPFWEFKSGIKTNHF